MIINPCSFIVILSRGHFPFIFIKKITDLVDEDEFEKEEEVEEEEVEVDDDGTSEYLYLVCIAWINAGSNTLKGFEKCSDEFVSLEDVSSSLFLFEVVAMDGVRNFLSKGGIGNEEEEEDISFKSNRRKSCICRGYSGRGSGNNVVSVSIY